MDEENANEDSHAGGKNTGSNIQDGCDHELRVRARAPADGVRGELFGCRIEIGKRETRGTSNLLLRSPRWSGSNSLISSHCASSVGTALLICGCSSPFQIGIPSPTKLASAEEKTDPGRHARHLRSSGRSLPSRRYLQFRQPISHRTGSVQAKSTHSEMAVKIMTTTKSLMPSRVFWRLECLVSAPCGVVKLNRSPMATTAGRKCRLSGCHLGRMTLIDSHPSRQIPTGMMVVHA